MLRLTACILALFAALTAWPPSAFACTPESPAAGAWRHDRQQVGQQASADKARDTHEPRDRWKWWLYDRAELGITDKQSAEIDKIFESTMPQQRAKREELERMEAVLANLTTENKADVSTVAVQAEKVESLRAEMGKTRTVMLYRINLLLSPEQRVKVKALIDKRNAERGRNPDSSKRR
jgi:P pilus assembly/Cpx signaling pathway, periplasmic inhibitor/zinc-resistance associated protein